MFRMNVVACLTLALCSVTADAANRPTRARRSDGVCEDTPENCEALRWQCAMDTNCTDLDSEKRSDGREVRLCWTVLFVVLSDVSDAPHLLHRLPLLVRLYALLYFANLLPSFPFLFPPFFLLPPFPILLPPTPFFSRNVSAFR